MGHLSEGVPSGEGPMWSEDPLPDQLEYELNRALTDPDEDDAFRAHQRRDRTGRSAVCDLHEVSGCVICHPKPRPVPLVKPVSGARPQFRTANDPPIIPAAFDSDCSSCEGPIWEGDLITVSYGEWVHAECAL